MLKKEHLNCKISSGRIKPVFVAPDAPELLDIAARLTALYENAAASAMRRGELNDAANALIRAEKDLKLVSGLNKLLLDRTEFSTPRECDYPAWRRELFLHSAQQLRNGQLPIQPDGDFYGDLPDFEVIGNFSPLTPEKLLHRYNLAQAQGLIFYAEKLTFTAASSEAADLRKLLKAVKFFRLLAHFTKHGKNGIRAEISGPFALFGPTAKYALNLANILPALVNLPQWSLEAQIKFKERDLKLKLDSGSGLISHYRNLSGYIPEEIRLYHRLFSEKSTSWQITGETPFIDAGDQEIIFPDISFTSQTSGQTVHLELFHRWHAAALDRRIDLLKSHPELPLILGIDRALISEPELLEAKFANQPQLAARCWLFRDFPGVESTLRVLKKYEAIRDIPDLL